MYPVVVLFRTQFVGNPSIVIVGNKPANAHAHNTRFARLGLRAAIEDMTEVRIQLRRRSPAAAASALK